MKSIRPYLLTGAIVLIAVAVILLKYWTHLTNPWTRDGQVQANVIEIAPRVSGPIVALPIRDNQFVRAGDLLFEIDPRTYQANLDQARALFDQSGGNVEALTEQVESAKAGVEVARASINQARSAIAQVDATITKNKAELERQQSLLPKKATSQKSVERAQAIYEVSLEEKKVAQSALLQSESNLLKAKAGLAQAQATLGALGDSNPQFRQAQSALQLAQLNLEFTQVRAPTNGYVTNLRLRIGSHVVANQPALALVDTASYWVDGFFKENRIAGIQSGDRAVVTLMTYPRSADRRHRGQYRLGYIPAGWQHCGKPFAAGQPDLRVDPVGPADPRAGSARRGAGRDQTARGHNLLGAGQERQRGRPVGRIPCVTNPMRRSV